MTICAVIPVYNHGAAIGGVIASLRQYDLHCILVDDGSEAVCAAILNQLANADPANLSLVRLRSNEGKGGAIMAGMREAHRLGYSHALQIDADGQHDATDVPSFLKLSQIHPDKLILGYPVYDDSVPRGRLYGRYVTHIWVWINTLSPAIRDSMCGFRVYPLSPVVALLERTRIGKRMDFDIEIAVRLLWQGMKIVNMPTKVNYPIDGISHFRIWRDNLLISRMHARLFAGMLLRLPALLWRKLNP